VKTSSDCKIPSRIDVLDKAESDLRKRTPSRLTKPDGLSCDQTIAIIKSNFPNLNTAQLNAIQTVERPL
jgi:hypothetical protein